MPAVLYGCGIWPCVQERCGLDTDRVVGTARSYTDLQFILSFTCLVKLQLLRVHEECVYFRVLFFLCTSKI